MGNRQIEFQPAAGYITPPNQNVMLDINKPVQVISAEYKLAAPLALKAQLISPINGTYAQEQKLKWNWVLSPPELSKFPRVQVIVITKDGKLHNVIRQNVNNLLSADKEITFAMAGINSAGVYGWEVLAYDLSLHIPTVFNNVGTAYTPQQSFNFCNYTYTTQTGTTTDGSGVANYQDNMNCIYTVNTTVNKKIYLKLENIFLAKGDILAISGVQIPNSTSNSIVLDGLEFDNQTMPLIYKNIVSVSNTVSIQFITNSSGTHRGWQINYETQERYAPQIVQFPLFGNITDFNLDRRGVTAPCDAKIKCGEGVCTHCDYGIMDDTRAIDINWIRGQDAGIPVYAIEEGIVVSTPFWNNSNLGQLLLEHTLPNGQKWYSGYLHMENVIEKRSQKVKKGDYIGRVYDIGAAKGAFHLHLVIYDKINGKLISRDVSFNTLTTFNVSEVKLLNKSISAASMPNTIPNISDVVGFDIFPILGLYKAEILLYEALENKQVVIEPLQVNTNLTDIVFDKVNNSYIRITPKKALTLTENKIYKWGVVVYDMYGRSIKHSQPNWFRYKKATNQMANLQENLAIQNVVSDVESKITLSPNPSNGDIKISMKFSYLGKAKILVFDILGNNVYSQEISKNLPIYEENLQLVLNNGIYIVKIFTDDEILLFSQKLSITK